MTSLTSEQQYILFLLRKSLGCSCPDPLNHINYQDVYSIIRRNGILLTVYNVLPDEGKRDFQNVYLTTLKQAVLQRHEGDQILKAFGQAELNCMALKGWVLCQLYPKQMMRQMADLDILIQPYDYEQIKTILENLGFSGKSTGSSWKHDSFIKGEINVEIHKRLTDDSDIIQNWEKEMWIRANQTAPNIYEMILEDFYIFHFVHMHKDFLNGSLGLRRIVDTWLLSQNKDLNMAFVKNTLDQFGIWNFHERMIQLSRVVMGETSMDTDSEILLKHAFNYGIYGTDKSYKAGRIAAMSAKSMKLGKIRSFFAAVFLPYSRMKAQFPIIKQYPFLLPVFWTKRIIHFIQGNMTENKRKLDYSNIDQNDYEEMKRFFEAGGIR